MRQFRPFLVILAAFALLASTASQGAQAQTASTYYFEAGSTALDLTLFGTKVLSLANTAALAQDGAPVTAEGYSVEVVGDAGNRIGASSASHRDPGSSTRDPAGSDTKNCTVPGLPEQLTTVEALLAFADVCSSSSAAVDSNNVPVAFVDADAGRLAVNGQALSELIFDILLEPILTLLTSTLEPITTAVVDPVDSALAQVCANLPDGLTPSDIVGTADGLGLPIKDAILLLPDGQDIYDALGDDCILSLDALLQLSGVIINYVEDQVRTILLEALDRDLLTFTLGGSDAIIASSGGVLRVAATSEAVSLTSPSLQFLVDIITGYVVGVIDQAIDDVTTVVPDQLADVVAVIPDVSDVVTQVLDNLPLDDLIDDEPLIGFTLAQSIAVAEFAGADKPVDTSGSSVGAVVVSLSPAIAELLGVDPVTPVAVGQDVTIAEGTPLESRIQLGTVEQLSDTLGTSNVPTTGARANAIKLSLLTGLEGGIVIDIGAATARAGGTINPAIPPKSLPETGSDSKLPLLAAGVLALLGLAVLRRRHTVG